MKIKCQVWDLHGDPVIVVKTHKNRFGMPGQMVDFVRIVSSDTPSRTDRLIQFRGKQVIVDCRNILGASCNAFGRMIGYIDEDSMSIIEQTVETIRQEERLEIQQRREVFEEIRSEIWKANPKLAQTMRTLNEAWNTDFIYVTIDPRGCTDKQNKFIGRLCVSYGMNRTTDALQFLGPRSCAGPVALGLHQIGHVSSGLGCFDAWMDAFPIDPTTELEVIAKAARTYLSQIKDRQYQRLVSEPGDLLRHDMPTLLDDFSFSPEG